MSILHIVTSSSSSAHIPLPQYLLTRDLLFLLRTNFQMPYRGMISGSGLGEGIVDPRSFLKELPGTFYVSFHDDLRNIIPLDRLVSSIPHL